MHLGDFDFDLPRELIAERPIEPREMARLLVLPEAGGLVDRHIADLPQLLRPGDLLVFNDTKVIPARLVGRRGLATVEITLARDLGGGVDWTTVTLHVGPGTFVPVKTDDPRAHRMHAEWGLIDAGTAARINAARTRGGRIVAVGTTSLRLLESAADESGLVHDYRGET